MFSGVVCARILVQVAFLIYSKHAVLAARVASDNDFRCSRLTSFFSSKLESPSTNSATLVRPRSSKSGRKRALQVNRVLFSPKSPNCRFSIRCIGCHFSAPFSANGFDSSDLNSHQSFGRRLPLGPQLELSHLLALLSKNEATYYTGSAGCNVGRAS